MSYLYIKRFVEDRIREVSQPVEITDEVRRVMHKYNIPEETVKNGFLKVNLHIKRQNKHRFSKQVVHQLVQQIMKNEQNKLMKVNDQLQKVEQLVQPVIVPEARGGLSVNERVNRLQELVEVLPEPAYLFALDREEDESEESEEPEEPEEPKEPEIEEAEENEGLILDDQDRVERVSKKELERKYTKEVQEEIKDQVASRKASNEELRQKYTDLREKLIERSQALIYHQQKAEYLKALEEKSQVLESGNFSDSSGLEAQITRFRILVEKLEYATSKS